jgi:hypothetical protein
MKVNASPDMPLFDLLVPYETRRELLQNLSAYDVAKLDVVLGGFLDSEEREVYLSPIRDLIWNTTELRALEAHGMQLLLMGNDISALQDRVQYPRQYIRKYGHSRKLRIYLVGHFPVMCKTTGIRDRLISYTLSGAPSESSLFWDTLQARRLKHRATHASISKDARFLMSFGACTYANEFRGLWLHVPHIPDLTIDLRVYVPSFGDRLAEEVQLPCRETLRLSKCALRRCGILSFCSDILYMYLGGNPLNLAHLSSSGIQAVEAITKQTQITVRTLLGHRKLEICQANLAGRV